MAGSIREESKKLWPKPGGGREGHPEGGERATFDVGFMDQPELIKMVGS